MVAIQTDIVENWCTFDNLVRESLSDEWGALSVSLYDTAYTVRLAPTLRPAGSLALLLDRQNADGSWGSYGIYRQVPSLAATAALLSLLCRAAEGQAIRADRERIVKAALAGLDFLAGELATEQALPDTVAIELIIPSLLSEIADFQENLAALYAASPDRTTAFWQGADQCSRLRLPRRDMGRVERLRAAVQHGLSLPIQLGHSLEVLGADAASAIDRIPAVNGIFGCSPAATAAVIAASPMPVPASHSQLTRLASRYGGGQPAVAPIPVFERAWIMAQLLQSDATLNPSLRKEMCAALRQELSAQGIGGGAGLPPDGDDTGMVIAILTLLDNGVDPSSLAAFESDTAFLCYPGERTPSPSTNAHILDGLNAIHRRTANVSATYEAMHRKAIDFLLATQNQDGWWMDKWHASAYYATTCSILALRQAAHKHAGAATARIRSAEERTCRWLQENQRSDGSWGRWHGTLEETAYALQILCGANDPAHAAHLRIAIERGYQFIINQRSAPRTDPVWAALWHDKDLYRPERVVDAAITGTLGLVERFSTTAPIIMLMQNDQPHAGA